MYFFVWRSRISWSEVTHLKMKLGLLCFCLALTIATVKDLQ